jgi:hypothetical protein
MRRTTTCAPALNERPERMYKPVPRSLKVSGNAIEVWGPPGCDPSLPMTGNN